MTNGEVATIFLRLADYLEIAGENPFKTRAYRNAAQTLQSMTVPIADVAAAGGLGEIPGFGPAIIGKTKDILATGTTKVYAQMQAQIPEGVLEFLKLPGIGVKTVNQLWDGLQVCDLDELELAAKGGRVRTLKGMSEKTEVKILDAIARYRKYSKEWLLDAADDMADALVAALNQLPGVTHASIAGDLRRRTETVGDIVLVVASDDPAATVAAFTALPQIRDVVDSSTGGARVILSNAMPCELLAVAPGAFAAALAVRTGSTGHVDGLISLASEKGFALSGDGLFRDGERISTGNEDALYGAVGLSPIPPTMREDTGEIVLALSGALPRVVQLSDIRGNLHQHTTASDGHNTIEEMAAAGVALGYEYMAITDHSKALAMTNGLTVERLRDQIKAVREAEQTAGIRLFAGSEVDILADGTMDFPDDVLAELDIVVASVHSRFSMERDEMTARVLKAVSNPHVDILAHPTGRLLTAREPYDIDIAAVIEAAAESHTALEINAFPDRLDLNETYAKAASAAAVPIVINTDAHKTWHLGFMKYGVAIAQRAWLTKEAVLNTRSLAALEAWIRERG
ncbi:MAG TPA: DNA polymerase/3'-5' exonuclease PolX [Capsulimonadaceae bacterium]|jgi:DNA polymerase (family 10)